MFRSTHTSANSETSELTRLVTHAYLSEFDSCMEYPCKRLDKFAEVDSAVSREIEQNLGTVKRVFDIDKLHL